MSNSLEFHDVHVAVTELETPVRLVLADMPNKHRNGLELLPGLWQLAKQVMHILGKVHEVTKPFYSQQYSALSWYLPLFSSLRSLCKEEDRNEQLVVTPPCHQPGGVLLPTIHQGAACKPWQLCWTHVQGFEVCSSSMQEALVDAAKVDNDMLCFFMFSFEFSENFLQKST